MAENMKGKILRIQDGHIYFDYKGKEGEGLDHYINIDNSNWPGTLPYRVYADMPGDNSSHQYPAFGGMAIVDPGTMAVTGLSPELENKDAQAEIIAVFQEYVNSHPEIGKAWEETMHSAKKLDRVHFDEEDFLKHYVDIVSLGKKDNKEEFLFSVVCEEDFYYSTYLTGERCTVDLNTGNVEFSGNMNIDNMGNKIMHAVKKSIDQYYIEGGTKDRSISPEYFNPPQRPENPLDTLQKIIEKNAPEEGPALEEIRKYMEEMNNNYKSMRSELQSLREQMEERSYNAGLGKKVVESLEKNKKSFKERIDGFKKKLFQKAADVIRNFKEKGTIALHNIVQKLGIKENIQSHTEYCMAQAEKMQKSVEKLDAINAELNSVKGHIKNIGRAIIGKEAQDPQQQKENIFIKMLKRPYTENRDSYMKMAEQGIKRLDRLEALEAKAAEARLHQGEKGAKRDSTLQKLSDYKKEAASMDEVKKDAPSRENIKKDLEMAL